MNLKWQTEAQFLTRFQQRLDSADQQERMRLLAWLNTKATEFDPKILGKHVGAGMKAEMQVASEIYAKIKAGI